MIFNYLKYKEICNSNKVTGPCSDFKRRWYFDIESKMCSEFQYGGKLLFYFNFQRL